MPTIEISEVLKIADNFNSRQYDLKPLDNITVVDFKPTPGKLGRLKLIISKKYLELPYLDRDEYTEVLAPWHKGDAPWRKWQGYDYFQQVVYYKEFLFKNDAGEFKKIYRLEKVDGDVIITAFIEKPTKNKRQKQPMCFSMEEFMNRVITMNSNPHPRRRVIFAKEQ
jgi:hypothetical protein